MPHIGEIQGRVEQIRSGASSAQSPSGGLTIYRAAASIPQASRSGRFTITHASIAPTDKLSLSLAPGPYDGKGSRADEAEMVGPITFSAAPSSGSAVVYWSAKFVQRGSLAVHYLRG